MNEPTATNFNIGAYNTTTAYDNFFRGDVAEVLVYDHALSDTEQETVRTYLQDKYGIEGYVPPEPLPLELQASWSFDQDGADSVGGHDMTLNSEANDRSPPFPVTGCKSRPTAKPARPTRPHRPTST